MKGFMSNYVVCLKKAETDGILTYHLNPLSLRNAKVAYNLGLSGCKRVNDQSLPSVF